MKTYRRLHLLRRWPAIGALAGVAVILLLGLVIGLRADARLVRAQTGPTVSVVRDALGQQAVTVAITGAELTNLGGFESDLGVDSAVAQMQGATAGNFLGSSGRTVSTLGPILGSQGETVGFGVYSYDPSGSNGPGASGEGVLALASMAVVGDGVSSLTLSNAIFADVDATQQQVATVDAALQVPVWLIVTLRWWQTTGRVEFGADMPSVRAEEAARRNRRQPTEKANSDAA